MFKCRTCKRRVGHHEAVSRKTVPIAIPEKDNVAGLEFNLLSIYEVPATSGIYGKEFIKVMGVRAERQFALNRSSPKVNKGSTGEKITD